MRYRGTHYQPDPISREVCSLPGAWIWDITEKLANLLKYRLLPTIRVHVGASDTPGTSLGSIKRE